MSMIREGSELLKENDFGVHETMLFGQFHVKDHLSDSHPLENKLKNLEKIEDEMTMNQLRISQGLYAPFKFQMECDFAKKIGRLPCLRSSNLMLSVIRGTDETIGVEDVFNNQREFCEHNTDIHYMMEKNK